MQGSNDRPAVAGGMLMRSTRRPLKRSEMIARDLVDYIIDAQLPAGAMLPREKDMVEQLGVGRTTLREALRILETRGVLVIRSGPGGGPVVRHPGPSDFTEALTMILQFQRATMQEVHDARLWIEPIAAEMAASRITKAEIKRLKEINREMSNDADASDDYIADANQRFHRVIAGATGNAVIQVFVETMLTVADTGIADINHSAEFKLQSMEGHDSIIAALAAKDPVAARDAMREHIAYGKFGRTLSNRDLMMRPLRWVQQSDGSQTSGRIEQPRSNRSSTAG